MHSYKYSKFHDSLCLHLIFFSRPPPYDYPSKDPIEISTYRANFRESNYPRQGPHPTSPLRKNNPHPRTMTNAFNFPSRVSLLFWLQKFLIEFSRPGVFNLLTRMVTRYCLFKNYPFCFTTDGAVTSNNGLTRVLRKSLCLVAFLNAQIL